MQVVDFVAACHDRKVLRFDVALRNLLLADDRTIRAIDLANSSYTRSCARADYQPGVATSVWQHIETASCDVEQARWRRKRMIALYALEPQVVEQFLDDFMPNSIPTLERQARFEILATVIFRPRHPRLCRPLYHRPLVP